MLLCLDFGGSSIKYGLVDTADMVSVVNKGKLPNTFKDQKEFLDAACGIAGKMAEEAVLDGIAVSYCGELDHEKGIIFNPGTYPYNAGLRLKDELEKRTGLPVSVENDGNAAMLAEWKYGGLREYNNAAMIVIGTGIAGSFIIDGKLHTGRYGLSGMLSFCASDLEKPLSLENMAMSSAATRYLIREYLLRKGAEPPSDPECASAVYEGQPFDGMAFFERVAQKDPDAEAVLDAYAGNLARFIMNLHFILELEAVAIAGGVSAQDALMERIQREADRLFGEKGMMHLPGPDIRRACLGADANLIGAAAWFCESERN